LLVFYISN